tara:strand:+ start:2909 stop:4546 length:1638 start_codon:yes stop_codon:yes gene_type:complete
MKFLFISVQKTMDVIGLKCLHYTLIANSFKSSILFTPALNLADDSLDELGKFVDDMAPDIIGFSVMTIDVNPAAGLSMYLKEHFPGIPIIWGGHHPTVAPETCMEYADFVLMGEADEAILDIANALEKNQDLESVPGLYFKKNGETIKNDLAPVDNIDSELTHQHVPQDCYIFEDNKIRPLDDALSNKFDRFAGRVYNILTSRGCPLSCTFCCNSYLKEVNGTGKIRRRSVENFVDEIETAIRKRPDIAYVNFLDDFFVIGSNRAYWEAFSSLYKQRVNLPFFTKPIPRFVTKENIASLKKAGLTWVGLGLQASDRVNREEFNRPSFSQHFLDAARICADEKIACYYDLIVDNPFETKQDKVECLRVLRDAPKPCLLSIYSLTYFPGTELYNRVHKNKLPGVTIEDATEKDHIFHNKSIYNHLVRLAAYLNPKMTEKIISMYEQGQESSLRFKVRFHILRLFSTAFVEPLNYFLSIKLSQGGSFPKTVKVLPIFLKEGLRRYFTQFQVDFFRKKLSYLTPLKKKKHQQALWGDHRVNDPHAPLEG